MVITHLTAVRQRAIRAFAAHAMEESVAFRNVLFLWSGDALSDTEAIRMLSVIDARRKHSEEPCGTTN